METHPNGPSGLGEFLRSRRERLSPAAAGVPTRSRRRTPGLRREEVAELAGIGVDWYVRLEQGRAVSPSAATVDALAVALRLDETEKRHLQALTDNPVRTPFVRERVPKAVARLVGSLDRPAYVVGRRWDVLAWNDAAVELITDFGARSAADRNILVYLLLDPSARALFGRGWRDQARRVVAKFRAAYDLWAPDPAFVALAERLRAGCPEFDGWWHEHAVGGDGAGRKVLTHPRLGRVVYDFVSFQAVDAPDLTLTVYTPA